MLRARFFYLLNKRGHVAGDGGVDREGAFVEGEFGGVEGEAGQGGAFFEGVAAPVFFDGGE